MERKRKKKAIQEKEHRVKDPKIPKAGKMNWILVFFVTFILICAGFYFAFFTKYFEKNEDWTVMVYMAGDNSLSNVVDDNLEAMMEIGSNDIVDIVVLSDKSGNSDSSLVHVEKGKLKQLELGNVKISGLNEIDTGDPQTLSDFGVFSLEKYPSSHAILIMWGHGKGWKGVASDKSGSILTMEEMRTALENIVDKNGNRKLDIIGFDACAMSTSEGFYEISEYADVLISSQKKEPDAGWPYKEILKRIATGKVNGKEEISKMVVKQYVRAYSNDLLPSQGFTVGLTAVRTSQNNDFYKSFQRLSSLLNSISDSKVEEIKAFRGELESYEEPDNIDLKDFLKKLSPIFVDNPQLSMEISSLSKALDDAVILERHWNNPESNIKITSDGGLCLYYPTNGVDTEYKQSTLAIISEWDEFLDRVT